MAVRKRGLAALAVVLVLGICAKGQTGSVTIPAIQTTALDGHQVALPKDLADRATVLILGFGRHSSDATTAWEKPVRMQLARPGQVGFYDMAMLQDVPGFVRPWVLRAIKHAVPDVLKPHFLPLTEGEAAWKRVAGYDEKAPEAAYVMLIDEHGNVRWSTHEGYSAARWQQLTETARELDKTAR